MTDTVKRIDTGVDDVLADVGAAPRATALDGLREELARTVANAPVTFVIPARPTVRLTFDTNLDTHAVQQWRKRAQSKDMPDGVDTVKFSAVVLANQMTGMEYHEDGRWTQALASTGEPLTFHSRELVDMLGGAPVTNAIRHLFGSDAAIFKAVEVIFEGAGFVDDEDGAAEDPTVIF